LPGVAALAPAIFFAGVERSLSDDSRPALFFSTNATDKSVMARFGVLLCTSRPSLDLQIRKLQLALSGVLVSLRRLFPS
jgi:hypothetical protein